MAVTETIHHSFGSRLGGSFRGVLLGAALFVVSFPVLFLNEGRAVRRARALDEGAGAVVSVDAAAALPENEGRLVHFAGAASTPAILRDGVFGVETNAIALRRTVETFQWEETETRSEKKNVGGSSDVTIVYDYRKGWSEEPVDSSEFKEPAGHENPTFWPVEAEESYAEPLFAGAFRLPDDAARHLAGAGVTVRVPVDAPLPAGAPRGLFRVPQGLYWSASLAAAPAQPAPAQASAAQSAAPAAETNAVAAAAPVAETNAAPVAAAAPAAEPAPLPQPPAVPAIGDQRISLSVTPLGNVSVVGRQGGSAFEPVVEPYVASNGESILLLSNGRRTAEEMFASAKQANRVLTWILRAIGLFLMYCGLRGVLGPLSTLADVLPFLGRIVSFGTGLVAGVVSLALSFGTIGLAWLFYRPLVGIPLLVAAVALLVWLARRPAKTPAA